MWGRFEMRVVLLSETFSKGMGYLENLLPKYFARLGAETHVVATDLPCFYRERAGGETYNGFHETLRAGIAELRDGYTLHILGHRKIFGHMRMTDLRGKLREIRPDIVQTSTPIGWIALDAATFKDSLGYRLFTGCHHHASIFPLANKPLRLWSVECIHCFAFRTIPGWLVSQETEKCYAITEDCAEVARRFFGVPRSKLKLSPLGVDTQLFHPMRHTEGNAERSAIRARLGFREDEIVCIYTGRFSADKNPVLLARAVAQLRHRDESYRGFFVGNGSQAEEILKCGGCVIHPFVPVQELGAFYRAADIGVWPAQESLSMLDAAACGLPIIANDTMSAKERLDGNGVTYRLNDQSDLVEMLLGLSDAEKRRAMGENGARKMAEEYSWESIARNRLRDYQIALGRKAIAFEKRAAQERITLEPHGRLPAPEVEGE
jgi:glycosyltransferase involved in cell wall biosynthesis